MGAELTGGITFVVASGLLIAYVIGSYLAVLTFNIRAWQKGEYGLGSVLRSLWVGAWWPWYALKALLGILSR